MELAHGIHSMMHGHLTDEVDTLLEDATGRVWPTCPKLLEVCSKDVHPYVF